MQYLAGNSSTIGFGWNSRTRFSFESARGTSFSGRNRNTLSGFGIEAVRTLCNKLDDPNQLWTAHQHRVDLWIVEVHQKPQYGEQMRARPRTLKKICQKKTNS
jgi:hypothetical protein